jgi:hypothetical protein
VFEIIRSAEASQFISEVKDIFDLNPDEQSIKEFILVLQTFPGPLRVLCDRLRPTFR